MYSHKSLPLTGMLIIFSQRRFMLCSEQSATTFLAFSLLIAGYDNGRDISYDAAISIFKGEQTAKAKEKKGRSKGSDESGVDGGAPSLYWDLMSREHVISYRGRDDVDHRATFPTLMFIQVRAVIYIDLCG